MNKRKALSVFLCAMVLGTSIPTSVYATETIDTVPMESTDEVIDTNTDTPMSEETTPQEETASQEETTLQEEAAPQEETTLQEETAPQEEITLTNEALDDVNAMAAADTAEGDKTVPGWIDENDGHARRVYESFSFVEDEIAYKIVDGGVEVAPWYWVWAHTCERPDGSPGALHTVTVWCGSEYANRNIEVPATITHDGVQYSVVGIGENAFNMRGEHNIKSVTLPEGIQYIGNGAFYTAGIQTIHIPASVTSIGNEAFSEDARKSKLSSITFAENSKLTSIGYKAFDECSQLTEINLPKSLTTLGSQVFKGCDQLTSVTIPASVTNISTDAFDGYYSNGNVTFEQGSIFKIQDGVLYDNENLIRVLEWKENVVVPEGIKHIGDDAFNAYDPQHGDPNANILKSITFPNSLETIGGNAFRQCFGLTEITIPKNVKTIGTRIVNVDGSVAWRGPFSGCKNLKKATILAEIEEMGGTFNGCESLSEIVLPDTLKIIGGYTFSGCSSLTSFDFSNIEKIEGGAFYQSGITEFIGGDKLTSIGNSAFFGCTSLKKVIIPEGITTISNKAFQNCNSIDTIIIPSTVTSLGNYALRNSFAENATIIMQGENPPTLGNDKTFDPPKSATIIVPKGSENNYANDPTFGEYMKDESGEISQDQSFSINLDKESLSVCLDSKKENTVTVTSTIPKGAALEVTSSDEKIATVIKNGKDIDTYAVNGLSKGTAVIEATITLKGVELVKETCTVTVSDHVFDDKWSSDDTKHWQECKVCGSKNEEKHTLTWVTQEEPTCTEKGSEVYECSVCKHIAATRDIDAAGHIFKWVVDKEATTTEKGSKHEECEVCGYKKASVEIPATGTKPNPGKPDNKPNENKPATDTNSVKTGDQTNIGLYASMLAMSGLLIAIFMVLRKKK